MIRVENLSASYRLEGQRLTVLKGVSFAVARGEMVAILGASGSGKSTLLSCLGTLSRPDSGKISFDGQDVSQLSRDEAALFRNRRIGFIFQQFHLLPRLSVRENILMPTQYPVENPPKMDREARLQEILRQLNLEGLADRKPQQLSGGQQQRVAIARALVNDPDLILADEPTGNLDNDNADEVLNLLKSLQARGKTVILITHDEARAARADRMLHLKNGALAESVALPPLAEDVRGAPASTMRRGWNWRAWLPGPSFGAQLRQVTQLLMQQLQRNRLRSLLTIVGVAVGIAAVVAMTTLGRYTKDKILSSYAEMGVRTVTFNGYPNWGSRRGAAKQAPVTFMSFDEDKDIKPLMKTFPQIDRISPVMQTWGAKAAFGGLIIDQDVGVSGVNEYAMQIMRSPLVAGSPISALHVRDRLAVCVIGSEIAERLFADRTPLGQVLSISGQSRSYVCQVIGVLAPRSTRSEWRKPNLQILLPYTYMRSVGGNYWENQINTLLLELREGAPVEKTAKALSLSFEAKYGSTGRFNADSDASLIEQMTLFLNLFSMFLTAISVLSLTIGGVGLTNMMLVTVAERFREIGLRKALGATDSSLRWQFLLESSSLCAIAGIFGLFVGVAAYQSILWGATKFFPKIPFEWVFDPWSFLFSFFAIFAVGLLSGLAPALRAQRLSPTEALRSE